MRGDPALPRASAGSAGLPPWRGPVPSGAWSCTRTLKTRTTSHSASFWSVRSTLRGCLRQPRRPSGRGRRSSGQTIATRPKSRASTFSARRTTTSRGAGALGGFCAGVRSLGDEGASGRERGGGWRAAPPAGRGGSPRPIRAHATRPEWRAEGLRRQRPHGGATAPPDRLRGAAWNNFAFGLRLLRPLRHPTGTGGGWLFSVFFLRLLGHPIFASTPDGDGWGMVVFCFLFAPPWSSDFPRGSFFVLRFQLPFLFSFFFPLRFLCLSFFPFDFPLISPMKIASLRGRPALICTVQLKTVRGSFFLPQKLTNPHLYLSSLPRL